MQTRPPRKATHDAQQGNFSAIGGALNAAALLAVLGMLTASPSHAQPASDSQASMGSTTSADAPMPGQDERPTIEPQEEPWFRSRATRVGMPASSVDLDPSVIGPLPGQPAPPLHREGDFVVDQLGRLHVLPSSAIAFEFIDTTEATGNDGGQDAGTPKKSPRIMVLQPCQRLQTMLSVAEQQQGESVLFRVTGQVHVYRGVNYLLPTALTGYQSDDSAEQADEADADPQQAATDADDAQSGVLEALQAVEEPDEPISAVVGVKDSPEVQDPLAMMNAMADELAEEAKKIQTGNKFEDFASPVTPSLPPVTANGAAAGGNKAQPRREGEFIVSRPGRMVRSADMRDVLFSFEADGPELAEPPIGVLPCRLRAYMEDAVVKQGDAQVFVVSGRVYRFMERDYFLPSVVKLRIGDDNLGG